MPAHRHYVRAPGKLILVWLHRGLPWRVFIAIFTAE